MKHSAFDAVQRRVRAGLIDNFLGNVLIGSHKSGSLDRIRILFRRLLEVVYLGRRTFLSVTSVGSGTLRSWSTRSCEVCHGAGCLLVLVVELFVFCIGIDDYSLVGLLVLEDFVDLIRFALLRQTWSTSRWLCL